MKTCALVIGHKSTSQGALNKASGMTEFTLNEQLAMEIGSAITGVNIQRVYRRTYRSLPEDLNELKPDFIISLHCNAFNGEVSGTEVLYYHRSKKGKKMAQILQDELVEALKLPDRGIKPRSVENRGGFLLKYTNAPCLIAEPFFIDNDSDLEHVNKKRKELVIAYVKAINKMSALISC